MKNIKIILIILIVVAVAGSSLFVWAHYRSPARTETHVGSAVSRGVNLSPPSTDQKSAGDAIKQQNSNAPTTSAPSSSTQQNTITISRLGQAGAGQLVSLRTILGSTSGDGCTATFALAGQPTITKTVGISTGPTYDSCQPIDISANEFSANGTWQATVYVQLNGSTISNKATASVAVLR